ncbi:hypothetical protein TSOC_000786 [Tetrabaena socialis]|uniref:Uncharacterized protein n=1 Tax=Tetrabaena socialis TaxID=47790 RepID=A0A2J8AID2_9CHLO|nr:hypothetical protein TSOC_000786 [Tetrabaena socialis]|eukprot:PNH12280.1 hypothetical protein TSOC_000786 [Tetrabaena socialis]
MRKSSYAIKYIYDGPHAADFNTVDLCLNLLLTLFGFFPGIAHALYLFMRHKHWPGVLRFDAAFARILEAAEALVLQLISQLFAVHPPQQPYQPQQQPQQ